MNEWMNEWMNESFYFLLSRNTFIMRNNLSVVNRLLINRGSLQNTKNEFKDSLSTSLTANGLRHASGSVIPIRPLHTLSPHLKGLRNLMRERMNEHQIVIVWIIIFKCVQYTPSFEPKIYFITHSPIHFCTLLF